MKKILIIIVALMLTSSCALAKEIDFDWKSLDDASLRKLNREIQLELISRHIAGDDGITVPTGKYIVGEDIPAGDYVIEIISDSPFIGVFLYADESENSLLFWTYLGESTGEYEIGKLKLTKGQLFSVTGKVLIYAYTGLFN